MYLEDPGRYWVHVTAVSRDTHPPSAGFRSTALTSPAGSPGIVSGRLNKRPREEARTQSRYPQGGLEPRQARWASRLCQGSQARPEVQRPAGLPEDEGTSVPPAAKGTRCPCTSSRSVRPPQAFWVTDLKPGGPSEVKRRGKVTVVPRHGATHAGDRRMARAEQHPSVSA